MMCNPNTNHDAADDLKFYYFISFSYFLYFIFFLFFIFIYLLFFLFCFFTEKIRFGFLCESSAQQMIYMKCQVLFSLKNNKKITMSSIAVCFDKLLYKK